MPVAQSTARRSTVDIDTRRGVFMIASARKPHDVVTEKHEDFVRRTLKARLGWPHREPAPQSIKDAAKAIAAQLIARDKALADAKAAALASEDKAKYLAVAEVA
jgi:hypothetical protein